MQPIKDIEQNLIWSWANSEIGITVKIKVRAVELANPMWLFEGEFKDVSIRYSNASYTVVATGSLGPLPDLKADLWWRDDDLVSWRDDRRPKITEGEYMCGRVGVCKTMLLLSCVQRSCKGFLFTATLAPRMLKPLIFFVFENEMTRK